MEASWFKSDRHRGGLTGELPVMVCLSFCRRDVADGFEQAMVVEPGHPLERRELHRLLGLPRCAAMDQLGLVESLIVSVRALSKLRPERSVHHLICSAHPALGARGRDRSNAAALGPQARCDDIAAIDHRACVRNAKTLDGLDALPDEDDGARWEGDESSRACLPPQARDERFGDCENDEGDAAGGDVSLFRLSFALR